MTSEILTITFVTIEQEEDQNNLIDLETDDFTTKKVGSDESFTIVKYTYEPNTTFGSSSKSTGKLYIDKESDLVGVLTYNDYPKGDTIIREIDENIDGLVYTPKYTQEASAQFYSTFGFNGYTTSFREDVKDYSIHSEPRYVEPDEIMKERAMNSDRNPSDNWLAEITDELIESDYFVSSMDCMFEENGDSYSFSNPMRVTGIKEGDWHKELQELIFKRMKELIRNNVPTVDEVKQN